MITIVIVLIIASAAALLLALTERTVRRALRCPALGISEVDYTGGFAPTDPGERHSPPPRESCTSIRSD
jgi:hypothetical protein